jgi:hypothetical protein
MLAEAPTRQGFCTDDGWAAAGVGPNCTFVGKRIRRDSGLLVGSCARNIRRSLEQYAQAQVTALLTAAGEVFTFGVGEFGVLGHGTEERALLPRRVEALVGEAVVALSSVTSRFVRNGRRSPA